MRGLILLDKVKVSHYRWSRCLWVLVTDISHPVFCSFENDVPCPKLGYVSFLGGYVESDMVGQDTPPEPNELQENTAKR